MKILKHLLFLVLISFSFCVSAGPCMAATLNWKGYTWTLANGDAWDAELNTYSSSNVVGPDANGYITLKLTNPSGEDPIGADMYCEQDRFGYGTYTTVIGSRLDNLDKNIVFSGMTVRRDKDPWFEFDGSEASRWDYWDSDVEISHELWFGDDYDVDWHGDSMSIASDSVQTHRMVWEPGKVTFDSFLGTGIGGTNYFHTVITRDVPEPTDDEYVEFMMWVYADGYPNSGDWDVPATSVVVRDFTFVSYYAHALNVTNGTGDGTYESGDSITITADAPSSGQVFDKWTGDTSYLASTTSATTTVTMPAQAVAITATYKTAPVTTYALTVNSGTGDGYYTSGAGISIAADAPVNGKVFDRWTGDTTYLSGIYTATATVTMPAQSIALTATYKDATIATYALTVTSGTGDGSYASGTSVTITADAPVSGQVFDRWTGDTAYLSSIYTSTANVTVPSQAIVLIATYKTATSITYTLTVTSGTGDGTYATGTSVTITADDPASGQVFDRWTGSTPYVSDTTLSTTTVTMPAQDITLVAVYEISSSVSYEDDTLLRTKGSTEIFIIVDGKKKLIPNLDEFESLGYEWIDVLIVTPETLDAIPDYTGENVTLGNYNNGTLIQTADSFKVYVIIDGKKKWIPTPEVFEQLGYKWTSIVQLSRGVLDSISDYEDNLIRSIGDYKVYLVVSGVKRHIPNPDIFLNYGFKWEEVKDVPQETIDKYRNTYLIKASKTEGVYYLSPQEIKKLIPTTEIFNSYNDKTSDVQIISQVEMNYYPLSNLIKLSGTNDIYLVEGTVKRKIPTAAIFDKYRFNWNYVLIVNQTEFNFYQTGADLK
ncbi:MAG: hypothetical protein PHX30_04090 [Candidatus Pacebacteria bacterium]|nr:hypothetical protein [Candidatus Paceibacterota bacterium]